MGRRPSAHLHFRKAKCRAFVTVDAGPLEFWDRVIWDFSGPARCIFLEFLVWILAGTEEVDEFQEERKSEISIFSEFFLPATLQSGRTLHPKVQCYIKDLYNDKRCKKNTAFYDLLKVIENHLLRIREEKRWKADELDRRLGEIAATAAREQSYLLGDNDKDSGFKSSRLLKCSPSEKRGRGILHSVFRSHS